MAYSGLWQGAAFTRLLLLLLLSFPALCSAGLGELGPTIDGQRLAVFTLQEGESRTFTCWGPQQAAGTALVWYLDGQRQEANSLATGTASTFTFTTRRTNHELNCSLTDPASGETYNTSIILDVQYKPEILRVDAHYQEVKGAGLLLVLFVLVQANPPARVTWVDHDGHVMANASEFLLLSATHSPGLANHSLRIHLGSVAGNFSISAANSVGVTTTSLLPTGLLETRVELPLLGVAVGAAVVLGALLSLGSRAACLACCRAELVPGSRLPRQTQSLPPNLRLSDLMQEPGAFPVDAGASARGEESTLPGLENPLILSKLGFIQLPKSGRIYKVPSTSSEDIWL